MEGNRQGKIEITGLETLDPEILDQYYDFLRRLMNGDDTATWKKEWLFDFFYAVQLGKNRLIILRTSEKEYRVICFFKDSEHQSYVDMFKQYKERRLNGDLRNMGPLVHAGYYWRCFDQGKGVGPSSKKSSRGARSYVSPLIPQK